MDVKSFSLCPGSADDAVPAGHASFCFLDLCEVVVCKLMFAIHWPTGQEALEADFQHLYSYQPVQDMLAGAPRKANVECRIKTTLVMLLLKHGQDHFLQTTGARSVRVPAKDRPCQAPVVVCCFGPARACFGELDCKLLSASPSCSVKQGAAGLHQRRVCRPAPARRE